MQFDVETVNKILGIDDAYKAPTRLMELMMDAHKREDTFKAFLKIDTDLSFDWFHHYFEEEQAQRKTRKQDFTPDSVSTLLQALVGKRSGSYYEPAAGTGGLMIKRWVQDRATDPVTDNGKRRTLSEMIVTTTWVLATSTNCLEMMKYWTSAN
ncbi:N-6 DNA methylase [Lactobacillus delbrueckii]|uniref:N-6 DNA methylase n=1 Tax=Lactobacillus delbrueckii TaxID=1584 RepID=UPI002FDC077B